MPRKKHQTAAAPEAAPAEINRLATPAPIDSAQPDSGNAAESLASTRTFKSSLRVAAKGVTLGVRDGHDWVVAFPEDPGRETKDRMQQVGFAYRDRKWKVFTHAPNRQAVAALVRELKGQYGDEMTVNEYPVKQVVLAFDAPPGDEITTRLQDADFHFRSDYTWNADYTGDNQKFARDLIQSLPDIGRAGSVSR